MNRAFMTSEKSQTNETSDKIYPDFIDSGHMFYFLMGKRFSAIKYLHRKNAYLSARNIWPYCFEFRATL